MKCLLSAGMAVALFASAATVQAEGLQAGDAVGAYTVEKVAGNPNDGVEEGQKLCYRCKMGARPVVAVFARSVDGKMPELVTKLDSFVEANTDKKAASFVNLLGDDAAALKTQAKTLIETSKADNVAVVVPDDTKTGPANHKIDPNADVTVVIYKEGKVAAAHSFAQGELNDAAISKVIADSEKIVN